MDYFYPEIVLEWDVRHFGAAALWPPQGLALVSYLGSDAEGTRFGESELDVLAILLPAFE